MKLGKTAQRIMDAVNAGETYTFERPGPAFARQLRAAINLQRSGMVTITEHARSARFRYAVTKK